LIQEAGIQERVTTHRRFVNCPLELRI